jgi:gliding motility associated protien GldN
MKPFYYIILLLLACTFAQDALSQTQTPQRRQTPRQRTEAAKDNLPSLSTRAAAKNEDQYKNIDNMIWIREVYRWIDLRNENNSPLYFPEQAIGDRMNLFTLIFKLVAQDKVNGYTYLDGREIFTDNYKVKFNDILTNLGIQYTTQRSGDQTIYVFDDNDIPSSEVLMYNIKEAYYFDQATGMFNSKVLAICPMILRQEDDYSEPEPTALFWLQYEDIRPYISRAFIMTSNINNALTYTMDDFFNKKMYEGNIVKTTNMMNRSLIQEVGNDPEKLKTAQDSIESQLKFFEENLWVPKDTTTVTVNKKDSNKKSSEKKESKPKEQKIETGPTKSVRRTR